MSQVATKQDIDEVKKNVDEVLDVLRDFIQQVDERFTNIEREIGELKDSHNRLLNTIDAFVGRIDRYETEQLARDNQFERLLAWARKVSEKTGIPLENL